ncbi:MAG TPA: DUF1697 domain-containing protein [Allosphingosinicella sp.]|jgi:uncharacterized protein (DUF1697 family)|nr:DUF1697 domain-containing protein [Allosphingosinicella sp.]
MRWAALLRGVNVGGNRKLPMADLKTLIEGLGFERAETLLASGNVVFEAPEKDGAKLESLLEREAKARIDVETDFLLRDAAALKAAIASNPFAEAAEKRPGHLLVLFARAPFPADLRERVAAIYDGPESLAIEGRHLYVDYVEGQGRSKLSQALAKLKLPKGATGRNWNTVLKLAAMLER